VAEVIAFYLLIISLYSFDVIGIKDLLEREKESKIGLASYFWNVFHSRVVLFLSFSMIALATVFTFFESYLLYLLAWLPFPLGMVLQNNYYFQAMENNHILAYFVVFFRVVSAVGIYVFSGEMSNPVALVLAVSVSFLLSGLASIIYVLVIEKIEYQAPSFRKIGESILSGRVVFLGGASVMMFRGSNTLILAFASVDPHAISLYSLAEKFIKMLQAVIRPLNQLYFPKTIRQLADVSNRRDALKKIFFNTKLQLYISLGLALIFVTAVYFDANHLHAFFNPDLLLLISIMTGAVVFGVANYMLGTVGLVAMRGEKYYTSTLASVGAVSVIACYFLGVFYQDVGAALAYVGSELALLILFLKYYRE